jgi:hypothetical protein
VILVFKKVKNLIILLQVEDAEYIDNFHTILRRFFQALGGIVPIFTYMVSSPCLLPACLPP